MGQSSGEMHPFYQVDVFSSERYRGNPVAVTIVSNQESASRFTTEYMANFARWTNLSETTFILPPSDSSRADYRLRIFTPGMELPFAGHPTLGSCRAWLAHGGKPKREGVVVQECGLGFIEIQIGQGESVDPADENQKLAFAAPPLRRSGPVDNASIQQVCEAMGMDPSEIVTAEWIVNGPEWIALQLKDAQAVLDVRIIDPSKAGTLLWGVFGTYAPGQGPDDADYEVRTFAPCDNILVSSFM